MNFFRSEEHLRRWEGFQEKHKEGIIALNDLMHLFSGSYFKNRRSPDYFSHMGDYLLEMISSIGSLENAGEYWRVGRLEKMGISVGKRVGLI